MKTHETLDIGSFNRRTNDEKLSSQIGALNDLFTPTKWYPDATMRHTVLWPMGAGAYGGWVTVCRRSAIRHPWVLYDNLFTE